MDEKFSFDQEKIIIFSKNPDKCLLKRTKGKKRLQKNMKKSKLIDFALGKEKTPILFKLKNRSKLVKWSKFDYKLNYLTKSYLKGGDIDMYLLGKEYSCTCKNIWISDQNLLNTESKLISSCSKATCDCIMTHLQNYECNNNCRCNVETCENRLLQKGIKHKLSINFISKTKGFGVFANENIKEGAFICEYIGQIVNKETAMTKINLNMIKKKPNYVLQIREHYEKMTISTFIDAEEKGNISRFLNHSCEPNLQFDIIRVNHFIPHVGFYAKRDIKQGEELTFCYSDGIGEKDSQKLCECGSEFCRKYLPSS
jgi:hypothetical protein